MSRAQEILCIYEDAISKAQDLWHASRHARIPGTNYGIDIPGSIALSAGATAISRAMRKSKEKAIKNRKERMSAYKKSNDNGKSGKNTK